MAADIDLPGLISQYGSEDRCRQILERLRWPNGPRCTRCGSVNVVPIPKRPKHRCRDCKYHFAVTAGTIFHDSHLPLTSWFLAAYLMIEARKGVSANQLKRTLGVSYKTAWYLCHRVRSAMHEAAAPKLAGIVDVDETYIGGKKKGIGSGNYRDHKVAVAGAIQRGGMVMLKVIERANRPTLHRFIREVTAPDTKAIYTDDANAYKGIGDADTKHEWVNHKADEWVRADVHTNTVENVWSLFKRSIVGSYHQLSKKHLPAYIDEMAFRFNNRNNAFLFRDTMLRLLAAEAMPYRKLVNTPS